jgi:hypothetical protein
MGRVGPTAERGPDVGLAEVRGARGLVDGTTLAVSIERRCMVLSFILSIVVRLILAAGPQHGDARFVRTEVADGSVWADVFESHAGTPALRTSTRLADADPRLRFVPVDLDGDGRLDVIAFALDGRALQLWRGTDDGFQRMQ